MLNQVTQYMNGDTEKLFIHILICHIQELSRKNLDVYLGVPAPRESFIHKFFRKYHWRQLEATKLVRRLPYDKDNGICFRYKLNEEWVLDYVARGADYLLNLSKLKNDDLYDVSSGKAQSKIIKPFKNPFGGAKPLVTKVNIEYAVLWLTDLKNKADKATGAEQVTLKARYTQALYCFKGIVERTTSRNYKTWEFEYCQELVEPDEGCRMYEVGGGLLGMPKDLRAIMLVHTPVVNIDAVKCHANIAHHEMTTLGIDSGLEAYIDNKITDTELITNKSIKVAILATLNGAKAYKKLPIDPTKARTTLHKLVHNDPTSRHLPYKLKQQALTILINACQVISAGIKQWSPTLTNSTSMPPTAETFQRTERTHLAELHKHCCSYQHDGALINAAELHLARPLITKPNNSTKLEIKPISNNSDKQIREHIANLKLAVSPIKNTVKEDATPENTDLASLIFC